jgi:hypothetical protein
VRLPNFNKALVEIEKLRDYSLNPLHPEGKHKARVFAASLGFTAPDAAKLRALVLAAVLTHDASFGRTDEHGDRYTVDFETQGLRDMVTIRTAWIIGRAETVPRLVSCYVKRKSL